MRYHHHPLDEVLYRAAVTLVSAKGSASPPFIQRKMNLPYNVAQAVFRMMQRDGIVGTTQDRNGWVNVIARDGFQ